MTDTALSASPLVTFALFAYNQERYIREAIEGAFAQTYEPLEIILSDDCSNDATFAIMKEMAKEYHGPHKIVVRQNPFNIGTALHVQSAFSASSGVLFVVAAGDDISRPDRVATLCSAWSDAGSPEGVIHSGREVFGNNRKTKTVSAVRTQFTGNELAGFAKFSWLPAAAPTCAFTRGVFERFPPLQGGSIIEDAPLFFRSALIGKFLSCDEQLVRQRVHRFSSGTGYGIERPAAWNRFVQSKFIAARTMQRDLASCDGEIAASLRKSVERAILRYARGCPSLLLAESRHGGVFHRAIMVLRILRSAAMSGNLWQRCDFAMRFVGIHLHRRLASRLRDSITFSEELK